MNKVGQYLNEHLLGEVQEGAPSTQSAGILSLPTDLTVYPRDTNDIRKTLRFAWQLAERGHRLNVTAVGQASDPSGAATATGLLLDTSRHMDRLFEIDAKQRLLRLQPGLSQRSAHNALSLQGMSLGEHQSGTIGGTVASGDAGASYDGAALAASVAQLEVVLANGDVLQTERLSRREVERRKGQTTFEGAIYRGIDGLLGDHRALLDALDKRPLPSLLGYRQLAKVRGRDGSLDLTPLFIGAQGTLGVISELIMQADFHPSHHRTSAIILESLAQASDAVTVLAPFRPDTVEVYDGRLLAMAAADGKRYPQIEQARSQSHPSGAVMVITYRDFREAAVVRRFRRALRALRRLGVTVVADEAEVTQAELAAVRQLVTAIQTSGVAGGRLEDVFGPVAIPADYSNEYLLGIEELIAKHQVLIGVTAHPLQSIYHARPVLQIARAADRQKLHKLLVDYGALVTGLGGQLAATGGEGRLLGSALGSLLPTDEVELYRQVRELFDPHGILNSGVKQPLDPKETLRFIRTS